ncbi:LytR/AlgR family response regulator transcription factor [Marinomonas mediterranea]|jgi:Response regulator of the LytR/AlgR family|uniref:Two component transcriptional regulator, LytTR family n=1 Tax=Marinomonas mediterranea (strain ATCC 700492 / JCM 21426 / NBRC 103028 / MMB-1) TaxID=717774 RepID=F2K307_MARM1|nr:LytTR family DNA-binding domain-containing protein [Marinomonas mediterranea]ADZ92396.1 two component transcriptional regulator, LytTR family [Marinomonas mediterranea MMB-1]WCN10348.1 response regulator [Marinomonas mediterranea]WCN14394.1 response regulator [Marinomonas mediterranea]WCN18446.1 response regulator [Marinomonas mediterranea MMB-1]
MNILVVDDEPLLRFHLQKMLSDLWLDVDTVFTAGSGIEALDVIEEIQPHTVFMDIKMPGLSGLETAKRIRDLGYAGHLVFVTAYDEHAIEAFEQEAIDYLLKPLDEKRLLVCIERLKKQSQHVTYELNEQSLSRLLNLSDGVSEPCSELRWINAQQGEKLRVIDVYDVRCFIAEDKYTTVVTDQEYLIRTPIKQLITSLKSDEFWRIHRSIIVQVKMIEKVVKDDAGRLFVHLHGVTKPLPVSRANMHLFKQM